MLLEAALLAAGAGLFLPAYTAYVLDGPNDDREESTPIALNAPKTTVLWGGYLVATGELRLTPQYKGTAPTGTSLRVVGPQTNWSTKKADGTLQIKTPGWYRFQLVARSAGALGGLRLEGPAIEGAKFNLKPRRNCASVHIGYPLPEGVQAEWFYNEIRAKTDPLNTYYMACGFARGYFGMQVNSPSERRVIFSVWDSGDEAVDRAKVAAEDRVQLLVKGDGVFADSFGNEGTGGHSHLVTGWKTDTIQRFLVHAVADGSHTTYTGYYYSTAKAKWILIASFRAPKDGVLLRGLYSFNEDFWGDNGYLLRKAEFGPAWVRTTDGRWLQLRDGRFTHDGTGGKDRFDYDLTTMGTRFVLQNGGFEGSSPTYGKAYKVDAATRAPAIDLDELVRMTAQ